MPNAPGSGLPNPASYTDLGNGSVRDNVTCLVWQKALNSPAASTLSVTMPGTITDNQAYCAALASSNYAGFGDWRIPTRVEIASVLDYTKTGSALTSPLTGTSGYDRTFSLWYETIAGINGSTFGWVYNLNSFGSSGLTSNAYAQGSAASVRCVRGNGSGEGLMQQALEPANHYTVSSSEVTDNYTGLTWQQNFSTATMPWAQAAGYCAVLNLNGHTWRVPSLKEFATIVNEAKVSPAVAAPFNGSTPGSTKTPSCGAGNWFWGREAAANASASSWGINFCDGFTGISNSGSNPFTVGWVKCVR